MHITAQQHRVADTVLLQGVRQAGARGGIAVPAVVPQSLTSAGLGIAHTKQRLMTQHVPLAAGACQGPLNPTLLRRAEVAALRIAPGRTGGRVNQAAARPAVLQTGLAVAILARIQQVERGQPAERHLSIDAHLGAARQPGEALRQHRRAQRHVLVIGLVGGGTTRGEIGRATHAQHTTALVQAGVVVLHLVVVPGQQPRAGGVHGLQISVALVQGVALAVVVQRQHPAPRHLAHGIRQAGVFVDVVAQEEHGI